MMEQRIDQRPGLMPRRGMHDQAGRLVDHQQVLILVDDIKVYGLRLPAHLRRYVGGNDDFVIHKHLIPGFRARPLTVSSPDLTQFWIRERECSGISVATAWSRR